jgi:hypothetical protein
VASKSTDIHFVVCSVSVFAVLIAERVTRGKQLRLSQGQLLGCGVHTFGYDYIRKTPTSRPQMIINEREAEIVRYVFETYAGEQIGLDRIAKRPEDMGAITKTGKKLWRRSFLKTVLRNETYLGVKYFNTMRCIREYANPIYDIKHSTLKRINRSREEWIGVEVPAIISRASGDLSRDAYVEKNRELDGMIETLNARSKELADSTVLLRKTGVIDTSIAQYCEGARVRFSKCCSDPATLRQFMLHYVEKVVHVNGKVSLHGLVPVRYEQGDGMETNTLPFCIESEITREERYLDKAQTAEAMLYQQSVALLREQNASSLKSA